MKLMGDISWAFATAILIILVGVLFIPFGTSVITVANAFFMIGLAFLALAAFFIIERGHLLAGWRRFNKRGGQTDDKPQKIDVRSVGSVKNGPIVVNQYARFCLINGGVLIILGIFLTV
ncbi:DUF3899 domain-containing protein [Levilactobacillus bambusae]|uniref:DUF3899 domain-containing protein n=1 Tax=Levilactobacillus bambusae TaxID=2024736 RepID=A0A2V1MW20_9LACO|nr:DUF3899 domain-containing protein [Levilactobacillus bambusae]PWF99320.1 DUF3899 domain-containing protein [Levilactobacillus bambusae]